MKKLVVAALLATAATAAQSAVVITFTGTSFIDGSSFSGAVTIDTAALGSNLETAPDTLYKGTSALTLTLNGKVALAGTPAATLVYSNADDRVSSDPDFTYGAGFSQQNDDGSTTGSSFTLYNSDYTPTVAASFGGVVLPDFRTVANPYLDYTSGGVSLSGALRITGYTVTANMVPEPASWTMMVVGFGLAGYALRRRRIGFAAG